MTDELDDELGILDESIEQGKPSGKVPAGLLALCILTIVGSVLILLKDMYTYFFYAAINDISKGGIQEYNSQLNWIPIVYLIEILSCLGTITAAIFMILRKKIGFIIYVVSTVLYAAAILWFWIIVMQVELQEGSVFLFILYLAAPIAFVFMYGVNRKHLY
jgi:hypothetical protein